MGVLGSLVHHCSTRYEYLLRFSRILAQKSTGLAQVTLPDEYNLIGPFVIGEREEGVDTLESYGIASTFLALSLPLPTIHFSSFYIISSPPPYLPSLKFSTTSSPPSPLSFHYFSPFSFSLLLIDHNLGGIFSLKPDNSTYPSELGNGGVVGWTTATPDSNNNGRGKKRETKQDIKKS